MYDVVVIDDEMHVRQGIIHNTDWESVECRVIGEAADGKSGFDLILTRNPDLVICDIRMPLMDGLEMTLQLRKRGIDVKIIFLTAYSDFSYIQKALRLGAVDYILKPFADGQLESAIRRITSPQGAENTGAEQEEPEERDGRLLPLVTQNPSMNRYVRSAIRYIEEHYREENVSISTVATALDLSEGHLSRLFKKDTGMSVSTYVTTFRIRVSMRLLRDVHCRVSEAARSAGYQDVGYFSNTFRKMTGMSPSEYQEKA